MGLRFPWQALVGVTLGLAAWGLISRSTGPEPVQCPPGVLISECDGAIRELVIQYTADADFVHETYRQFLGDLPAEVTVHAVCPDRETYDRLVSIVGTTRCKIVPLIAHHAMTTWSRDRWAAIQNEAEHVTLIAPRAEADPEVWPARAGDEHVAFTIAAELSKQVGVFGSAMYFDGGDFLADADTVFVTPAVVRRNVGHTVGSKEDLLASLASMLRKRIVVLEAVPDHHVAMYMVAAGNRTMVVGDPSLARGVWEQRKLWPEGLNEGAWQADFGEQTQELFDAAAKQAADAGYRVVRIPVVPGVGSRAYVTYTNGLLDQRESRRIVYLAAYRGLEPLNEAAGRIWRDLGYEVHPIDCTTVFPHFGTLHCLVNVLNREPASRLLP